MLSIDPATTSAEPAAQPLERLMRQVRACFQDMRAAADELHAGIGINASARALLEFVADRRPQTVSETARAKNVSRQHIQQLADALVAGGFAAFTDNPGHKRSPFVTLTQKGEAARRRIGEGEAAHLRAIAAGFPAGKLDGASEVLEQFRERLRAEMKVAAEMRE
jgi:DNA-binding MarR family transcriptional regulator